MGKEVKETVKEQEVVPPEGVPEDMLRQINMAADRLKAENERFEANQKVLEAQRVEKMLAGRTEVGIPKKTETPREYTERIMAGDTK